MAPLTERYNNPGAVEFHPWMSRYGATLGENGRFAQFQTPEQGYGVMGRILDTYQGKHGLNTVSGIINRWAPRNVDNNSTDEYIKSVSDALGLAPDAPLSADHRQPLMRAMANYEAGRSNLGGPTPTAQPSPQTATAMPITILPRSTTMPQNTDSPLVGLFRSSIENPLVLAGLGLYSASSQGQDIGSGLLRSVPLMQQADKMRQERERRAAVNELMNSPSMSGVNPTILGIARATGDPSLIAQDIYRGPQMEHMRLQNAQLQQAGPLDVEAKRLQNAKTLRELTTPPDNVKVLKENEQLITVDPRSGTAKPVYPLPGTTPPAESAEFRKARDKELGEARAKAISTLPQIEDNATLALKTIDQITAHPGRYWGTGATGTITPYIPGTDARGFSNLVEQAKGKVFLEAFNSLRGGGAITEAEGAKATQALARLDRAQSARDFDAALADIREVINLGVARARRSANGAPAAMSPGVPEQAQPMPTPSAEVRGPQQSVPQPAIDMLRQNPSPQMRKYFDETFGAGASDRALGAR